MEWWYFHYNWLQDNGCMLIITYRDMKENLRQVLQDIGHFLGIHLTAKHLECVVSNSEGNFYRPHKPYLAGIYTAEMNMTIDECVHNITQLARQKFSATLRL